jgi:hypothetical protein
MLTVPILVFSLVVISIVGAVIAVKCDKTEAELKIARAELAKYRRPHDSKGRFTK